MPLRKEELAKAVTSDKKLAEKFLKDPASVLSKYGLELNEASALNIKGKVDELVEKGLNINQIMKEFLDVV